MKTPKTDPEQEELTRLKEALSKHKSLLAEAEEYRTLQFTIGGEVEIFANSGDLRDTAAVSAIAVKQLQSSLIEKRIASLGTKLSESDASLTDASATVARLLIADLYQIKNAVTEQAAQAMKPHFQDYQDCRRKAAGSVGSVEVNQRIAELTHLPRNLEEVELAEKYLAVAPAIKSELTKLRESLGGSIPSEAELLAF